MCERIVSSGFSGSTERTRPLASTPALRRTAVKWSASAAGGSMIIGDPQETAPACHCAASAGVELLLQAVQHLIARQHLGDARVRLAALADRGEELAILQFDPVHRHVDPGDIDLFFLAVEEIVLPPVVVA